MKCRIFVAVKFLAGILAVSLMSGVCFAGVASVEDLKTAKVGVQAESVSSYLVRELLGEKTEGLSEYSRIGDMIEALKAGKIDAAVMDEAPARYLVLNDESVKILPEALATEYYAAAFRKGDSLRDEFSKVIEEMRIDGTLVKIMAKYMDGDGDPDPESIDMNRGAEGGKLWVGCAASFHPYELRTNRGFVGIDIEICAHVAKKLNKELVIADYRFEILPEALAAGKIDVICSAMAVTEERQKVMDFSAPYDANQEVIVVLSESK
ncbi:MAG: transporter substrate-binding domain-containing protein [Synergistaceae bacterium]|nr:transporter substrate-binding domain-containing protein [Synergistaceae bacterium]